MRTIVALMLACLFVACSEPVDPRAQFNLEAAQARWNSPGKQWQEAELRQLEYGMHSYNSFCAACHLTSGEGQAVMGAPALVNNSFVRGPVDDVARKVLFSKGSSMPPFNRSLDDEQIAAILSYVRNAWGDQTGSLIEQQQVTRARQAANRAGGTP